MFGKELSRSIVRVAGLSLQETLAASLIVHSLIQTQHKSTLTLFKLGCLPGDLCSLLGAVWGPH